MTVWRVLVQQRSTHHNMLWLIDGQERQNVSREIPLWLNLSWYDWPIRVNVAHLCTQRSYCKFPKPKKQVTKQEQVKSLSISLSVLWCDEWYSTIHIYIYMTLYIYMFICMYTYIYIYIEREIYIYTCVYVYIYIYRERERYTSTPERYTSMRCAVRDSPVGAA